jgi:hypothetical protein
MLLRLVWAAQRSEGREVFQLARRRVSDDGKMD